jgi:hypothetical protein
MNHEADAEMDGLMDCRSMEMAKFKDFDP